MSIYHDRELADALEPRRRQRTRRDRKAFPTLSLRRDQIQDEVFQRVRAACADESTIDVDLHAARIAMYVHGVRK